MLSKLIKYELKDASHSLFPIGLGMAILSVISALMVGSATKGFDLSRLPFYPLLSGLVGLLTFICVIAVVVICLMSNVGSFYRMLGHRGYLEMSLPVTIHQHGEADFRRADYPADPHFPQSVRLCHRSAESARQLVHHHARRRAEHAAKHPD